MCLCSDEISGDLVLVLTSPRHRVASTDVGCSVTHRRERGPSCEPGATVLPLRPSPPLQTVEAPVWFKVLPLSTSARPVRMNALL